MTVPLATEHFDPADYSAMDPVQMMYAIQKRLEFKLPPVGLTTHTANFGGYKWIRHTWRCEVDGCWYVSTPRFGDPISVEDIIQHHRSSGDENRCPTPPRRESLPSGLAEIEKLWREIDDVVDALSTGVEYHGMTREALMGYVKGLAFSVVMKDKDLWPDIKAVSAQAGLRRKMRQGKIQFSPTPTRHTNDFSSVGTAGGWKKDPNVVQPVPTAKKAAPRKAAPKPVNLPEAAVAAIQAGYASSMFSLEDLATTYGATLAQVHEVVGLTPGV